MATRTITPAESELALRLLQNARRAMTAIADYDQARVDRICQAVGWAGANPETAQKLANMSVDESGMGSRESRRRAKVLGILRDALRQKSMGVIEEIPDKGIVKYAKPAGVICSLIPVTSPYITPIGIAIYAIKCKDAVIFSPSLEPKDDQRNHSLDARGIDGTRRPRRRAAVRRAAEYSARE
jgi:sulfoacetaldehyde dehydrogenase